MCSYGIQWGRFLKYAFKKSMNSPFIEVHLYGNNISPIKCYPVTSFVEVHSYGIRNQCSQIFRHAWALLKILNLSFAKIYAKVKYFI